MFLLSTGGAILLLKKLLALRSLAPPSCLNELVQSGRVVGYRLAAGLSIPLCADQWVSFGKNAYVAQSAIWGTSETLRSMQICLSSVAVQEYKAMKARTPSQGLMSNGASCFEVGMASVTRYLASHEVASLLVMLFPRFAPGQSGSTAVVTP